MLCIDPLEGPRGLTSFANFLTPLGASRQVCSPFANPTNFARFEQIWSGSLCGLIKNGLSHSKMTKFKISLKCRRMNNLCVKSFIFYQRRYRINLPLWMEYRLVAVICDSAKYAVQIPHELRSKGFAGFACVVCLPKQVFGRDIEHNPLSFILPHTSNLQSMERKIWVHMPPTFWMCSE